MKVFSVGLIFVLCTISLATSFRVRVDVLEGESCEVENALTPHHDCSQYYQCSNGVLVVQTCALGTYFNPRLNYCDFPDTVPECVGGTRPPEGTTTTAATTAEPDTTTAEPDTTTAEPDTTIAEPDTTTDEPDTTTAEPDTTTAEPDTTTAEPDTTTAELDTTTPEPDTTTAEPDTTTAEPDTTTAEPDTTTAEPDTTTAEPDTTTAEPDTTTVSINVCLDDGVYKIPYPGNCSLYYLCANYTSFLQHCPENTLYDPNLEECNIADLVPGCSETPRCPENEVIYKPISGNCTAYIMCVYGVPYPAICPPGMEFDPNPEVLQCNYASEVACDDGSGSTDTFVLVPPSTYNKQASRFSSLLYSQQDVYSSEDSDELF